MKRIVKKAEYASTGVPKTFFKSIQLPRKGMFGRPDVREKIGPFTEMVE